MRRNSMRRNSKRPNTSRSVELKRTQVVRKLKFDSLEDRRLLAGLSVFVFEDANRSGTAQIAEHELANQVVYLDFNRNGVLNRDEPWVKTDTHGLAQFEGLDDGDYYPALFGVGTNSQLLLTSPVEVDQTGRLLTTVAQPESFEWKSDHQIWVANRSSILLIDVESQGVVQSTSLDLPLRDVTWNADHSKAILLLENSQGILEPREFDPATGQVQAIADAQDLVWKELFNTDSGMFALVETSGGEASLVSLRDNRTWSPVINSQLPSGSTIYSQSQANTLVVLTPTNVGSRIAALQLSQNVLSLISERELVGEVKVGSIEENGVYVSVQRSNQWSLLDMHAGLQDAFTAGNSSAGLMVDRVRELVMVFDSAAQEVQNYRIGTWQAVDSSAWSGPLQLREIAFSPSRDRILALTQGGLYELATSLPSSRPVRLEGDQAPSIAMGVTRKGTNSAPSLQNPKFLVDEDRSFGFGFNDTQLNLTDFENDSIGLFVVHGPLNGQLQWSVTEGGLYIPNKDFDGVDTIAIQAFDGLDWSPVSTLSFQIQGENDPPTGIQVGIESIDEDVEEGTELGVVTVLDPDRDATYRVVVGDPRLLVVDGVLRVAQGAAFDFESESTLTFEIIATDLQHPQQTVSRTVSLNVADRNDPPQEIKISSKLIEAGVEGASVGTLSVVDQDTDELYDFTVVDPRFTVRGNTLALRPGVAIDESIESVPVTVIATSRTSHQSLAQSLPLQVVRQSSPWQNPIDPMDVDGDGLITPRDPLIIINHLNQVGIGTLGMPPFGDGEPGNRVDVNGDGKISPIDILIVINHLNLHGVSAAGGGEGTPPSTPPSKPPDGGEGEGIASVDAPTRSGSFTNEEAMIADLSLDSYLASQSPSDSIGPHRGRKRSS